jgi:hypothetical protein
MDRPRTSFYLPVIFTIAAVVVAILLAPARVISVFRDPAQRLFSKIALTPTRQLTTSRMASDKLPVYFLSHGGVSADRNVNWSPGLFADLNVAKYHV